MKVLRTTAPLALLDDADASLVLRCVDACVLEELVAWPQRRAATLLRAELGRYLAAVELERDLAATNGGTVPCFTPTLAGVSTPAVDYVTVPQAAALLRTSDSFVRKYAPRWGGHKGPGGGWLIPRTKVLEHWRHQHGHTT